MSKTMEDSIKRWTAKRKTALVIEIIEGKTERLGGQPVFRPDALRDRGLDRGCQARHGELVARQPAGHPRAIRKAAPGPARQAVPSVAAAPNERWSTDLARIWAGKDGWASLALVIDCHTRELLGWQLSKSGKATTASAALEHALIARFCTLGKVEEEFLLQSDSGLVFTSHYFTKIVRSYGLKQEFITPRCPQQNGMVERFIRTLKGQCVHRHRFETIQHAMHVIGDWFAFYNNRRPHEALAVPTPVEIFRFAA